MGKIFSHSISRDRVHIILSLQGKIFTFDLKRGNSFTFDINRGKIFKCLYRWTGNIFVILTTECRYFPNSKLLGYLVVGQFCVCSLLFIAIFSYLYLIVSYINVCHIGQFIFMFNPIDFKIFKQNANQHWYFELKIASLVIETKLWIQICS